MITAQNYFDYAPKYINKFDDGMKAGHEVMNDIQKAGRSFTDPAFKNNEIGEVIAMQVAALNALAAKKSVIKEQSNEKTTPKPRAKSHKKPVVSAKKKTTALPNTTIAKKNGRNSRKTTKKRVLKSKVASKQKVKTQKPKALPKAPVTVKKLSKELQIIKSFASMDGKNYKAVSIENKHKELFNFLPLIVDHKAMVTEIWERIGRAVNAIKKANATSIDINIDKNFVAKCKETVSGASIRIRTEFLSGVKSTKKAQRNR